MLPVERCIGKGLLVPVDCAALEREIEKKKDRERKIDRERERLG